MPKHSPFRHFKTSPEIIRLAVMLYVRFLLSLRNVEDLFHERGIEISHETVRFWWNGFGPLFASEIRKSRVSRTRYCTNWQWHLDEVFVKINGEVHYSQRAVDHEGEVLESYVAKRRDRNAALEFLKQIMKRYGQPQVVVTDKSRSYSAAMKVIGNADRQDTGSWQNNRAENSRLPFRRREHAMLRFPRMQNLEKFTSVHASIYDHFNQQRHVYSRDNFKLNRTTALSEWQQLCSAQVRAIRGELRRVRLGLTAQTWALSKRIDGKVRSITLGAWPELPTMFAARDVTKENIGGITTQTDTQSTGIETLADAMKSHIGPVQLPLHSWETLSV